MGQRRCCFRGYEPRGEGVFFGFLILISLAVSKLGYGPEVA